MPKRFNPLLFIGLIGTLTIGIDFVIQLRQAFWGNQDIWWTNQTMQLPITESRDTFELFVNKKLLQTHLDEGTLWAVDEKGEQDRVVAEDVSLRLNNWQKVKASILTHAVISGFACGIVVTCLFLGVLQALSTKHNSQEQPH